MAIPSRLGRLERAKGPIHGLADAGLLPDIDAPQICNPAIGNPTGMPVPELVEVLKAAAEPQNPDWLACTFSEPEPRETVAASLRAWRGLPFDAADIAMTTGSFGAPAAAIHTLIEPDDAVLCSLAPPGRTTKAWC